MDRDIDAESKLYKQFASLHHCPIFSITAKIMQGPSYCQYEVDTPKNLKLLQQHSHNSLSLVVVTHYTALWYCGKKNQPKTNRHTTV